MGLLQRRDGTHAASPGPPLACPACGGGLDAGWACAGCGRRWPDRGGLPALYEEAEVTGSDRLMRRFYDGLPSLHDPLTHHLLPRLQHGASEDDLREGFLRRMDLLRFAGRRAEEGPLRVLEVGLGTGVNLPRLARHLPRGLEVEYWGMDLSRGMLGQCQRRAVPPGFTLNLVMGDVHALPFEDEAFDVVFHVGAMGSFRDPARALSELVRVARPGCRLVVVDEQLDPALPRSLRTRLAFWLVTFYDDQPGAPLAHLPPGVDDVRVDQITPFYYCLRFRKPPASSPAPGPRGLSPPA